MEWRWFYFCCACCSVGLTIKEQHPTGSVAGEQVAKLILADQPDANVLIVARATSEDQEFAKAAKQALEDQGATVLGSINGEPGDVRRMLQQFLDREKSVDAIAATDVTAKWSVYDRFDSVGNEKCVTPRSYQWPVFLKLSNVIGVLNQTAIYAIIAIGMTMVIITGGIDLGVGSLVALSAVTSSLIVRDLGGGVEASLTIVIFGMSFGILICAVSGIFVGNMVTRFQPPPVHCDSWDHDDGERFILPPFQWSVDLCVAGVILLAGGHEDDGSA